MIGHTLTIQIPIFGSPLECYFKCFIIEVFVVVKHVDIVTVVTVAEAGVGESK